MSEQATETEGTEEVEETTPEPERKPNTSSPTNSPAPSEKMADCPKCHAQVKESRLGDHMFHAHNEDRRQAASTAPPPEKVDKKSPDPTPKTSGTTPEVKKPRNRWFGDR